jgi:hypothetical protein
VGVGPPTRKAISPFLQSAEVSVVLSTDLWTLFFLDRTELFTTQSGARQDATKVLIVITDGRKQGDNLSYDSVIPMAEAASIIRYAIGVGHKDGFPPLPPVTSS